MKDIAKLRLSLLRELKNIRKFFDHMERGIKSRDPARIYPAYVFLTSLVYHMDKGDLSPFEIDLKLEILHKDYKNELKKDDINGST